MHGEDEKQESPAARNIPACAGFPTSWSLVGLSTPACYFGGVAGVDDIAPLLLLSAGAAGVVLSAGGAAIGAAGGGAAAAGVAVSELLLQAESTSAAAIALRASFVFIDGSPKWYVN
jgi:hypothetical protein